MVMQRRFILILFCLLVILFSLFGFVLTPYIIGKLAATPLPVITDPAYIPPIWMIGFFTVLGILWHWIFLYAISTLITLGLKTSKVFSWFKIATVSNMISTLLLIAAFLSIGDWGFNLAIAIISAGISTGASIQELWRKGINRISSIVTVSLSVSFGLTFGAFLLSALIGMVTIGDRSTLWSVLIYPLTFFLGLGLVFSIFKLKI